MVLNAIYISYYSGMHRHEIFCFSPGRGNAWRVRKILGLSIPLTPSSSFILARPATCHSLGAPRLRRLNHTRPYV